MPKVIVQPHVIGLAVKILQDSRVPLTVEQLRKKLSKEIYPNLSNEEINQKKGISWNTMRTITQQLINSRVVEPVYAGKMVLYRIRPL